MSSLARITGWFQRRAENLITLMLAMMFLTFLFQITFRYMLVLPVSWTNWTVEFVSMTWLWGILFGYAFVVRDEDVIRLDILYNGLPVGVKRVFDVITGLVVAGILAWTLPKCWDYVTFMRIERTPAMRIPFNYVFSIYGGFAIAVILRSLLSVWTAITGKSPRYGAYNLTASSAASHPEAHEYD